MSMQAILNQYWRLILVMMLPVRYLKWLWIFNFAIFALGIILFLFDVSFVLYIGAACNLLLLMAVGMLVPGQMLALRSSKQFQFMADLRLPLFLLALFFCLLASLVLTLTLDFFEAKDFRFNFFFAVIFMVLSGVTLVFAVVGSYMHAAQGFIPLLVWLFFFSTKNTNLLSDTHIAIYLLISIGLWLVMVIWWFRWQPQKFLVNFLTLPAAEMQRQQTTNGHSIATAFSAVPKTLAGSLLLGMSDGGKAWLKRELGQLAFFLLMLGFVLFFVKKVPENVAGYMIGIHLFIFIFIRGSIIFPQMFQNTYRLWMNGSYSRAEVLTYIEKRYFLLLVSSLVPAILVIGFLNHYLLGDLPDLFKGAYLLLISFLSCSVSFYLGLFVYLKTAASFIWSNCVSPIVSVVLIGLMVYFNILFGANPSAEHVDHLAFSAGLLILVLVGRTWVKSHWQKVNFFRVKN